MTKSTDKDMSPPMGDLLNENQARFGGEGLRAAREKAGVDIPALSFELRIPKSYIYALEAEDYAELPGATYGFGYIKSICKFIDVDAEPFLDTFKMRTSVESGQQSYRFPDEALEPKMSGAMAAMLVVLVLLSGYIGWQVFDRYQSPIEADQVRIASSVAGEADQNTPAVIAQQQADEAAVKASNETAALQAEREQAERGEVLEAEIIVAEVTEANETEANVTEANETETLVAEQVPAAAVVEEVAEAVQQAPQDNQESETPSSAAQANVRLPSEEIIISATSAAWVEVVSENGDVILSKLFQAGEDYIAPADKKLYLSTGNAGGLVLMIPGLDSFQAGAIGEIVRDLPLSRESIRSRRSSVTQ